MEIANYFDRLANNLVVIFNNIKLIYLSNLVNVGSIYSELRITINV